jgi:hypothetical protein
MTTPLLAFHGDPKIKRKYLSRIRAHRKADDIISGQYWEMHGERMKGCAVGCTLHSSNHAAYETELGIPRVLARLEDRLFEGLWSTGNRDAAKAWPQQFLSAAKPGADLSMVWPRFAHWLLVDETHGVLRHAKREKSKESIRRVAALYARWIVGDKPTHNEWAAAAYAAAAAAAYAAAYAAAADAAAAAYAAAAAAADAADAAADARSKHYTVMADKLIELIKAA